MKSSIVLIITTMGAIISRYFHLMDKPKRFLIFVMMLDFISGLIVTLYFKNSTKTESGAYSSQIGFKGILKKCMMLIYIFLGILLDELLNMNCVANAICFAFISNEIFSVLENGKLMNIKYPRILDNCLDIVKKKIGE